MEINRLTEREAELKPFAESIASFTEVFCEKWKISVQFGYFRGTIALSSIGALENFPDTRDILWEVRKDELYETLCTISKVEDVAGCSEKAMDPVKEHLKKHSYKSNFLVDLSCPSVLYFLAEPRQLFS